MTNGNGDDQAFSDGPTAFAAGPNAYGPQQAPKMTLPSASSFATQVPSNLGIVDPDYPQQREQRLDQLSQRESGGQNIRNPASTASGPWQMTNPTWRTGETLAGVPRQYPSAQRAPYPVQRQVARAVYDQYGETPWAQTVRSSPVAVASSALDPWTKQGGQ